MSLTLCQLMKYFEAHCCVAPSSPVLNKTDSSCLSQFELHSLCPHLAEALIICALLEFPLSVVGPTKYLQAESQVILESIGSPPLRDHSSLLSIVQCLGTVVSYTV